MKEAYIRMDGLTINVFSVGSTWQLHIIQPEEDVVVVHDSDNVVMKRL